MMDELEIIREQIDKTDEELVELFIKRMELVRRIGRYKAGNGMKVYDPGREKKIIERYGEKFGGHIDIKYLEQFMENLLFISRRVQRDLINGKKTPENNKWANDTVTIGYQGVPGCYSHQATLEYFGEKAEALQFHSFKDVFEALAQGKTQYGVLPIENSTSGSINDVYDLLREYEFHIVGEKYLKIEHNLLGVKGAVLSDIREVYSHQQGLIQCSCYLAEHPEWKQVTYFDTAGSAEHVAREGLKHKACIAGRKAALVYGLDIISANIQDNRNNSTRFVIISKERHEEPNADKISIIISIPHRPGSLYGILRHFAEGNCNLMKIESRPLESKPWEYFFYIDLSGNVNEEKTRRILAEVDRKSQYFRLLGNYKSGNGCIL